MTTAEDIVSAFVGPSEQMQPSAKLANKTLAKEAPRIAELLEGSGEHCLVAAHDFNLNGILTVTDKRTFTIRKGRIDRQVLHSDLAETKMATLKDGRTGIIVTSRTAQRNYSSNDPARLDHMIVAKVGTTRIGSAVCSSIDVQAFGHGPSADDDTSMQYLKVAPFGPRTKALAASCLLRVAELAEADANAFGRPITEDDVSHAAETVILTIRQDMELNAFVIREAWFLVMWALEDCMAGNATENLDTLVRGAGFVWNREGLSLVEPHDLSERGADIALSSAQGSLAVYEAMLLGPEAVGAYPMYVAFFTGVLPSGGTVDSLLTAGPFVVAWVAIAFGRLVNSGLVRPGVPVLTPEYKDIPAMESAGWYPNPVNAGIVNGVSTTQRYWDGETWTDRVRLRSGAEWKHYSDSLHDPPPPESNWAS